MIKVAVIGMGARGSLYSSIMKKIEDVEIVSVCEKNPLKKPLIMQMFNLSEENVYLSDEEFFSKGKLADVLIVSSMDQDHYLHATNALKLGYDLLLEKPIANTEEKCKEITNLATKLNRRVAVCHVLRYTPFFSTLKEIIESGKIGKVITISETENVGYFHYAHSYVRGNWRDSFESAPMIIAKCCHDLDILKWLINDNCVSVSSFGSLDYFKKENAPSDSSDYCYNCNKKDTCPYNAIDFYTKKPYWAKVFTLGDNIKEALENENNPYARCVYKCDNNVVDHQVVNMLFEGNQTAQLTMTAFSNEVHRNIKIHGTNGEIEGDMEDNLIVIKVFGKEKEVIDLSITTNDFSGHSGGDVRMIADFIKNIKDNNKVVGKTAIEEALASHIIGFAAERSRLNNGKIEDIK